MQTINTLDIDDNNTKLDNNNDSDNNESNNENDCIIMMNNNNSHSRNVIRTTAITKPKKNNRIVRTICSRCSLTVICYLFCIIFLIVLIFIGLFVVLLKNSYNYNNTVRTNNGNNNRNTINTTDFSLVSSAFNYGDSIPSKYSTTVSIPFQWYNAPNDTISFVLLMYDPDAPDPTNPQSTSVWIHWLLYDIPVTISILPEINYGDTNTNIEQQMLYGIVARNDWERFQYDGPSPPYGIHRYFIKLYALNTSFGDIGPDAEWELLEDRVNQHIINVTQYMGTYEKN